MLMKAIFVLTFLTGPLTGHQLSASRLERHQRGSAGRKVTPDTLLVYIFSDTDPQYVHNLHYFVTHGLSTAVDYVFVLQANDGMSESTRQVLDATLDMLPRGATVLHHTNDCRDLGTFGWVLSHSTIEPKVASYKYYIMLNASVKGPLLQPFFPQPQEWHRLLIQKFGGPTNVHMVGGTISCEGTYSAKRKATRESPHIQTWLLALDRLGLATVLRDGRSLACHKDREDAVWHGELGMSALMLRSGYNIACLLGPYQGVDWRLPSNQQCNGKKNPMSGSKFYGTTLHPYATLFTKYKQNQDVLERADSMYAAHVLSSTMQSLENSA